MIIGFLSPKKVYQASYNLQMPVFCGGFAVGAFPTPPKTKDVKWPSPQAGAQCLEDDELRYMSR